MKPVERSEILRLGEYEEVRGPFRARVMAEKKVRRVPFGPLATATFENHDTVLLQIQEMIRTERITREAAILHEIETYNHLVPRNNELSATVMIEIDDREPREAFLTEASDLQKNIALLVDGERAPAVWDERLVLPGRLSAVLYLRFPLSSQAAERLRTGRATVELVAEHRVYAARVELPPATVKSVAEDLGT